MNRKIGRFISFEGLDGSGKSTLIAGVKRALESVGAKVLVTREPGGTPLAEEIRHLILRNDQEAPVSATEILLYEASRAQHVAKVIQPALMNGIVVLCDRFSESTVAFQCFARGLSRTDVDQLNRFAEQGSRPELVVLLDLTVAESRRRQSSRAASAGAAEGSAKITAGAGPDRIEKEADNFHEKVRQGFLAQVREEPKRWFVVDAALGADELLNCVLLELENRGWMPKADGTDA
ncbi:MAG: dTMP kinase [Deltaproteobacteria bacterium]|nr:dTMP kinase [Deltaproteobacteria bacterium]